MVEAKDLEKKVNEIYASFKPSTTFEQGNLIETDYEKWNKEVLPSQSEDWERIKKLLRGTWGKLKWQYKGWVFGFFRQKYNWKGWATTDAVAFQMAISKVEA